MSDLMPVFVLGGAAVLIISILAFSAVRRAASAAERAAKLLERMNERQARVAGEGPPCPGCGMANDAAAKTCQRCARALQ